MDILLFCVFGMWAYYLQDPENQTTAPAPDKNDQPKLTTRKALPCLAMKDSCTKL